MTGPDDSPKVPDPKNETPEPADAAKDAAKEPGQNKETPEQTNTPKEPPEQPEQKEEPPPKTDTPNESQKAPGQDMEVEPGTNAQEAPQENKEKDPPSCENKTKEASSEEKPKPPPPKDIFFIYTPNTKVTKLCAGFLAEQGFNLINLLDAKYSHQTLEQRCLSFPQVSFAVVILNGENFVYSKEKKPADAKLRAPQDLVFAMGFFLGKFGRQNVFVLYQEQKSFILPTPYHHAIYTPLDTKELWKEELIARLKKYESTIE